MYRSIMLASSRLRAFAPSRLMVVLSVVALLSACGGGKSVTKPVTQPFHGATCTAGPKSRYGNPASYKVLGKWYKVMPSACGYVEEGLASWYGPNFHGKRTSTQEEYDMYAMTAAHKTLPIPAMVRVTNLENDRQIVVRVNDRGPFHKGRIIDLSKAAAQKLGVIAKGTARVRVEAIGEPAEDQGVQVEGDYRDHLYVQLGSFGERANAENMRSRLLRDGFDNAQIQVVSAATGRVNRVRVGPLSNPVLAQDVADRLARLGYSGYKIVTE